MNRNVGRAIRSAAYKEGICEQEVIAEMQKAIHDGYNSLDSQVQAQWATMPFQKASLRRKSYLNTWRRAFRRNQRNNPSDTIGAR